MKQILNFIIVIGILVSFNFCEKEIPGNKLQFKDGKYYEMGYNKSFTGKVVEYYPGRQKKSEVNYIDGVRQGEFYEWHENKQVKKIVLSKTIPEITGDWGF